MDRSGSQRPPRAVSLSRPPQQLPFPWQASWSIQTQESAVWEDGQMLPLRAFAPVSSAALQPVGIRLTAPSRHSHSRGRQVWRDYHALGVCAVVMRRANRASRDPVVASLEPQKLSASTVETSAHADRSDANGMLLHWWRWFRNTACVTARRFFGPSRAPSSIVSFLLRLRDGLPALRSTWKSHIYRR